MATIKDVAQLANVSFTTVSHVVNGTRFVSERTREKVLSAVEKLRYVPSATARALKTKRSHIVGMIMPSNSNPFFAEVVRGVEDVCFEEGYNLILCNSDDSFEKQSRYVRVLNERKVDGLVVLSLGNDSAMNKLLFDSELPHVFVDRAKGHALGADVVQVDHALGGYLAAKHLLSLGHTRIGCIAGPQLLPQVRLRIKGYKKALKEFGIDPITSPIREGGFTIEGGYAAMQDLLSLHPRPTAVFACNDLMAMGGLCATSSLGLAVPGDVSVIGFDDIPLARYTTPPLTTVGQPTMDIGKLAAKMLVSRIINPALPARRQLLLPSLQVRKSTAIAQT
jgi:LacI family transcriptional regulator